MKHLLARFLPSQVCHFSARYPRATLKARLQTRTGTRSLRQPCTQQLITLRSVKSNRNGEFDFRGAFNLGTYNIYSLKETDAYPDPTDKFYANPKIEAAKAELTEDHPSVTVAVSMGQKACCPGGKSRRFCKRQSYKRKTDFPR